jgi:hypothetical protein
LRCIDMTSLSGWALARRLTRWISVPTAHFDPGGAFSIVLMMKSVEPTRSAAWQVS